MSIFRGLTRVHETFPRSDNNDSSSDIDNNDSSSDMDNNDGGSESE